MPRFLNTWTGEFEWHPDPNKVAYAILSHTWRSLGEGGEQSYDEVLKLQSLTNQLSNHTPIPEDPVNTLPPSIFCHPDLSQKVKDACRVAREDGYRLLWIDACCIDKSSSAELSEAINSMFEWYKLASVCYAYLEDVPDDDHSQLRVAESAFRESRWHTRGWTLQELIAPRRVVFLSQTWRVVGTKAGLASILEDITGVDFKILTDPALVHSVSVARRMSWASRRNTTRVEDRAYSLLGIFDIHMSPIYGEGPHAFLRLQQKIVKTIPDQSIFAWGRSCILFSLVEGKGEIKDDDSSFGELFASSPSAFKHSAGITLLSPEDFASRIGLPRKEIPSLQCFFTSQGVRVRLPCIEVESASRLLKALLTVPKDSDASRSATPPEACAACMEAREPSHVLALLQCEDEAGSLIALPVFEPIGYWSRGPNEFDQGRYISFASGCVNGSCPALSRAPLPLIRLICLTEEALSETLKDYSRTPPVQELRLLFSALSLGKRRLEASRSLFPSFSSTEESEELNISGWTEGGENGVIFSFAPRTHRELDAVGFTLSPMRIRRSEEKITLDTMLTSNYAHGGQGEQPKSFASLTITFHSPGATAPTAQGWGTPGHGNAEVSLACVIYDLADAHHPISGELKGEQDRMQYRCWPRWCISHCGYTWRSKRTIVGEFRFDIPADFSDVNGKFLRDFRLVLERPALVSGANTLWVVVELSDKFTQPPSAAPASEAPPPTSDAEQDADGPSRNTSALSHDSCPTPGPLRVDLPGARSTLDASQERSRVRSTVPPEIPGVSLVPSSIPPREDSSGASYGDVGEAYASRESVETLRRENKALRDELSSQIAHLTSRIEALTASQASNNGNVSTLES